MDEEKKEEDISDKFGKIIDTLHNKSKLSSLRTYQGDVAEFIKEKNESVISIAVQEKEKKEEEKKLEPPPPRPDKKSPQINLTMLFLSLALIAGGVLASLYIFNFVKKEPVKQVVVEEKIIPYNNLITLANVTNSTLGPEIIKSSLSSGITVFKISGADGRLLLKAENFFDFLKIALPATLERTLKDEYAVGTISQNEKISPFIIITVNDFGRAFSAMLDWEENMEKDLSFLNEGTDSGSVSGAVVNEVVGTTTATTTITANIATSTAIGTTTEIKIPMRQTFLIWKDIITKNKDTRALINQDNQVKIAYTFLDKNTILITNNLPVVGEISSVYASRSVVR